MRPAALPITDEDGFDDYACPRQHINENPHMWSTIFTYYAAWQKGFLPDAGGVSSQSKFAMEVFAILDVANNDADEHMREQDGSSARTPGNPFAGR